MTDSNTVTADQQRKITRELTRHHGSLRRLRHWTGRIIYTPGVADMAELCGAYWLIDLVASHQITTEVRAEEFQVWTLTVAADHSATAIADDGSGREIARQAIEFTDFPLAGITLYLDQFTLMLPGEY